MILVTVGTQLPFDRLIEIVDRVAPGLGEPVVAQTGRGEFRPRNMEWHAAIPASRFETLIRDARLIVAHAGIGTVLMAQKHLKPLILFPRRASLGEHRNEHQTATAAALEDRPGIYVARSEEELTDMLRRPLDPPLASQGNPNLDRLNAAIADYVRRL